MKIQLTQGKTALVDEDDFEWLSKFKWHFNHGYALRKSSRSDGKRHTIWMHREVMKTPDGMYTDHKNGIRFDNRKSNLRVCTHSENIRNKCKQSNNTSGLKGVAWHKVTKKWQVQIQVQGKSIYLGLFATKELAYQAYCEASTKYHGEFRKL